MWMLPASLLAPKEESNMSFIAVAGAGLFLNAFGVVVLGGHG